MITKYETLSFEADTVRNDIKRLINQVWKLIPMREAKENWKHQLEIVLIETVGLQELFHDELDLLIIISKLEGLKETESSFAYYRSEIFSVIHVLGELRNGI